MTTQDPELRKRLDPDEAAERVYNFLHTLTIEAQMLARACGKTNIHSLEPEDLAALTMEASAMAKVPLAGTNYIPGVTEERTLARDREHARAAPGDPAAVAAARGRLREAARQTVDHIDSEPTRHVGIDAEYLSGLGTRTRRTSRW